MITSVALSQTSFQCCQQLIAVAETTVQYYVSVNVNLQRIIAQCI